MTFDQGRKTASGADYSSHQEDFRQPSAFRVGQSDYDHKAQQRANYALALQMSCRDVVKTIKASDLLMSNEWAKPLTHAPNAISIMALCLKTAAVREAANIKVRDKEITDETGKIIGLLPSEYFRTNLQHCADIGRLAFLDAQKRMNNLQSVARSMIAPEGTIAYIIDLLGDLEDAEDNLPGAMKRLETNAENFKADAEAITKKFDYWEKVIMHLLKNSQDADSMTDEKRTQNTVDAVKADAERQTREREEEDAKQAIQEQQKLLQMARREVEEAQRRLNALLDRPLIEEPSAWSDMMHARELVPDRPAPSRGEKGVIAKGWGYLFGSSDSEVAAENKHRKDHVESIVNERQAYIAKSAEHREMQRRMAQAQLDEARGNETRLWEELNKQAEKLSISHHSLTKAKHDLAKTHAELERLCSEKIELEQIMRILEESMRRLTELKKEVEEMALFFSRVQTVITTTVNENLQSFLNPIQRVLDKGDSVDKIRERSKQNLLRNAFELQGRFSATADVASMYVLVSNKYIRPGINKMEALAAMNDDDFERGKEEFRDWCDRAAEDIVRITDEQNLPDQKGKVFLVTDASGGLGKLLVDILYRHNGKVYLAARSRSKTEEVIQEIKSAHPSSTGELHFLHLELDDLSTIKPAATRFLEKESRLDVLWNNAGVMIPPEGSKTKQGYELQYGVNNIVHFLLTLLLRPALEAAAASAPKNSVRVVWVASSAADAALNPAVDLTNMDYHREGGAWMKYSRSKAASVIHSAEFARRTKGTGIISLALNPGNFVTSLQQNMSKMELAMFVRSSTITCRYLH
ncbi:hypothetical protein BFJ65_g11802 [Fusarium oxysporum f. sp. cepae]|uniref:Uncharacterized protein n=1 Tax=Fusarium oxysporum f. sp. cepae TaxID=396571 RepID=A0A3L6NBY1_FUSOX|nr:hypothetical protein BFJ65_g11802 [Fusarium oxysporum f. sp. cepae]